MLQQLILFHLRLTLLDSGSLSSAWGTRQRSNCTRQSLYRVQQSAKNTRQKINRQSLFCRVSFIAHSANGLPSVKFDTRQKKWFAECFSKIHSAKDYCLPSVFGITLGKPFFQRKKYFFITLGKPIFQRKKIFFSQHILLFQLTCTCQALSTK